MHSSLIFAESGFVKKIYLVIKNSASARSLLQLNAGARMQFTTQNRRNKRLEVVLRRSNVTKIHNVYSLRTLYQNLILKTMHSKEGSYN